MVEIERFAVGSIECQIVPDGVGMYEPDGFAVGVPVGLIRAALTASAVDNGQFAFPYNCLLIRTGGWIALVDTGMVAEEARQSGEPAGRLMGSLAASGRYLVSMLGNDANWVRNVRAAGGLAALRRGIREQVQLEEVEPGDRAPILRRYLAVAPGARPHLPVDRHAPLEEFERIADQYPVFHITPDAPITERGDGHTTRPGVRGALELSAHMTVRPGQLEGFKKQAPSASG
jgi:hypothetical protein